MMSLLSKWQIRFLAPELNLCHVMNRWGSRSATRRFFRIISRAGDGPVWYALIIGLALFGGSRGIDAAGHLAIIALVCITLYRGLKHWTRRPRPFARHGSIIAHIQPLDEFSFPSGHTLHATAFTLVACTYFPVLAWLLVPFALLIALSRVILGVHYPSDVLAAIAIALSISGLSFLVLR